MNKQLVSIVDVDYEKRILLIDDSSEELLSLSKALKTSLPSVSVEALSNIDKAELYISDKRPQVVILDLCLDGRSIESGFSALRQLLSTDNSLRIVMLTGHGAFEYGVRAVQLGAANFLQKPADIPHLAAIISDGILQSEMRRAVSRIRSKVNREIEISIPGESEQARTLRESLVECATHRLPVLLIGETGSGKGECSALLHSLSGVSGKFVRFQPCFGSFDLAASDLFGHKRGSFTGALEDRKGLIAEADRGVLFLDEVDEMQQSLQIMLLNSIQERKFRRLGSTEEEVSEFRLISATNCTVDQLRTKIRTDFYHRIAQVVIDVPNLDSRKQDIPLMAEQILRRIQSREQLNIFHIDKSAEEMLLNRSWPGNIRQLQAALEIACYKAVGRARSYITADDFHFEKEHRLNAIGESFRKQVDNFKLRLLQTKLAEHGGNRLRAARDLKIDRTTMRRILCRAGLK